MKKMTKNKTLVYALSAFGMALLCGLLSGLVFDYLPGYIVLWSLFGAILGSCISRVIFHIYYEDCSAEMWQVAIYHVIAAIGIVGIIFADTWGWVSFFGALIVGMTLMACGSRFIKYKGGTLLQWTLENTQRYYPKGDDPKAEEDTSRPIITYAGQVLTLKEAMERGLFDAVENAKNELSRIYGITFKEKKEKADKTEEGK